jgi:thiamine kinase-like enzyme
MNLSITSEAQITPEWLSEALTRNGHLDQGRVESIAIATSSTFFSHIHRLEITYSDGAVKLPTRMILKVPFAHSQPALDMGREEVIAYTKLHRTMPSPPILQCFDARIDPESGPSHLLIQDLEPTHFQPPLPVPPSRRHNELCVETLARLHAFWWESPALGVEVGTLMDEASWLQIKELTEDSLPKFYEVLGDGLSPERRRAYDRAVEFLPQFWRQRLFDRGHNTLIHGDAHSWNFMHPRDPENGRAYLIDLATLRVRPPTNDLAYMIAVHWYSDRRRQQEMPLLRHYHQALCAAGVRNYSWDECLLDYRYSVVSHLFTPVVQAASGAIPATVWWHSFERINCAFAELDCEELIRSS